jgi:hypothetical protein
MVYWLDEPRRLQDLATRRAFRVTLGVSLLVHGVALFTVLQHTRLLSPDEGPDAISDRMEVRLAAAAPPPPAVPAPPSKPGVAIPPPLPRLPKPSVRKAHPPQVLASPAPALAVPQPPRPTPPAPPQAQTQASDLWSYIQAKRLQRGEAPESLTGNRGPDPNSDLAANLPRPATGAATNDVNRGGGIFELKRMTYDDGAFLFFGWNPDMNRETPQLITVRIGDNPDMRIAVVRRMIALIREYTQGDFTWRSARHSGSLVLSARPADNANLEAFLLREFFDERGEPQ